MSAPTTPHVTDGSLILRRWDRQAGLSESPLEFHGLDELFTLCLETRDPELVDRIVIRGIDRDGKPRTLSFVFESVSITPSE